MKKGNECDSISKYEYVNQLQEDKAAEQLTLDSTYDPFTGKW